MVFFALNGTHQTASRLTWSFARDNAMFGSRWLNNISPRQEVPIIALAFNFAIMFVIGCIYLGSTSAFNAFIGTGLILQHITYAIPAALLMFRKRSSLWLPQNRYFRLPSILGWAANIVTVLFAIFVLVLYTFPAALPVTGSSMSKPPVLDKLITKLTKPLRLRQCRYWSDGIVCSFELVFLCSEALSWATTGCYGRLRTQFRCCRSSVKSC
jgi:choline transport protein